LAASGFDRQRLFEEGLSAVQADEDDLAQQAAIGFAELGRKLIDEGKECVFRDKVLGCASAVSMRLDAVIRSSPFTTGTMPVSPVLVAATYYA